MNIPVSHDRKAETPEAKARWFQSLPLSARMEFLCAYTDLILEKRRPAPTSGQVLIVRGQNA